MAGEQSPPSAVPPPPTPAAETTVVTAGSPDEEVFQLLLRIGVVPRHGTQHLGVDHTNEPAHRLPYGFVSETS